MYIQQQLVYTVDLQCVCAHFSLGADVRQFEQNPRECH